MDATPDKTYQDFSLLTLAGGSPERRVTFLKAIASTLTEKSIRMLVVYLNTTLAAQQENHGGFIGSHYDRVILDREDSSGGPGGEGDVRLNSILVQHCCSYDLVIICSTDKAGPEEVLLFEGQDRGEEPLFRYGPEDDTALLAQSLYEWVTGKVMAVPVWGCVLIGGKSTRMGQPKHLIADDAGITWGEKIATILSELTEKIVLSGEGDVPEALASLDRLTDIPGAQGPLAGILAAMRWNPHVSWIVAACDMPGLNHDGVRWLLNHRCPGLWGTVPLNPQSQRHEPLFAHYDFRSRTLFEALLRSGSLRPNLVCKNDKIATPTIPVGLTHSWCNCNTPDDLSRL